MEAILANVLWLSCLGTYFLVMPLVLWRLRARDGEPTWPFRETAILCAALLFFILFFDWLPRWPAVFNSDLELIGVVYLTTSGVYVASGRLGVASWRRRAWSKLAASAAVVLASGVIIFAGSWAVVYFE
jgi:hypothetical protein